MTRCDRCGFPECLCNDDSKDAEIERLAAEVARMTAQNESDKRRLAALRDRVIEYCSMRMSPDDIASRGELLSIAFESMRRMAEMTPKPDVCVGCVDYTNLDCQGYASQRELAALRAAVRYLDDRGAIDVQDETVWVRDGDDMQPAPPEHAGALRMAIQ